MSRLVLASALVLSLSIAGSAGARTVTITTNPNPVPAGVVGEVYALSLQVVGGQPPYFWSVTSGAIPPGLSLASTAGAFAGTPTTAGRYVLRVEVRDGLEQSGATDVTIQIAESATPKGLHITVPDLVRVEFEEATDFPLTAEGGTPPYAWRMRGALPPGLRLEGASIRGTATASTSSRIILTVTDLAEDADTKTVDFDASETQRRPVAASSGRSGASRRDSGCICVPGAPTAGAGWWLLGAWVALSSRGSRRAGRSRARPWSRRSS